MRVVGMNEFVYVHTDRNREDPRAMKIIETVNAVIKQGYGELISIGQAPEDARGLLPTNIATNIVCKFNLRTLAELARSRTGGRTQGEYQHVVNGLLDAALAVHPWASEFFFPVGRDYFAAIEAFALKEWPNDLVKRGELLKIVDQMRKAV
jgi:thymidylate synthase (FAD)